MPFGCPPRFFLIDASFWSAKLIWGLSDLTSWTGSLLSAALQAACSWPGLFSPSVLQETCMFFYFTIKCGQSRIWPKQSLWQCLLRFGLWFSGFPQHLFWCSSRVFSALLQWCLWCFGVSSDSFSSIEQLLRRLSSLHPLCYYQGECTVVCVKSLVSRKELQHTSIILKVS